MTTFAARFSWCRTAALLVVIGTASCFMHGPAAAAEAALVQRLEKISGVRGVSLRMPAELRLHQGNQEALVIQAEPHVLERIEVLRRDGLVIIQSKAPGFQARHPILLDLTLRTVGMVHADSAASIQADALQSDHLRVELEGSDDLTIAHLDVRQLIVRLSGSSSVTINAGQAQMQDVELDGAGDYSAPRFSSRRARVRASGSGSASVRVTQDVDAMIEGSGDIEVSGPAKVSSLIDGAGEILRRP